LRGYAITQHHGSRFIEVLLFFQVLIGDFAANIVLQVFLQSFLALKQVDGLGVGNPVKLTANEDVHDNDHTQLNHLCFHLPLEGHFPAHHLLDGYVIPRATAFIPFNHKKPHEYVLHDKDARRKQEDEKVETHLSFVGLQVVNFLDDMLQPNHCQHDHQIDHARKH